MDPTLEHRNLMAEDGLWWYRGRQAIVLDAVHRMLGDASGVSILDAGCGGGRVLEEVAKLGSAVGLEPSRMSRDLAIARNTGPVIDARLEELPFSDAQFDLALLLDVLEHLDDEQTALGELRRVVRPGGGLVLTVPAHPRFWTRHDDLNEHRRRYTPNTLRAAVEQGGWVPGRMTHFNLLLLPLALAGHRLYRSDGLDIPPAPINRALEGALHLERLAIRAGLRLPMGLSLLVELRRPAD